MEYAAAEVVERCLRRKLLEIARFERKAAVVVVVVEGAYVSLGCLAAEHFEVFEAWAPGQFLVAASVASAVAAASFASTGVDAADVAAVA